MKIDIRWQLMLAAICGGLVAALLGFQVRSASLCTTRVPAAGGRLTLGMIGQPTSLNPLLADANPVDQHLVDLIFDGLLRYDGTGRLQPNLAASWSFDDEGRRLTFQLRQDVVWHDGEPFDAQDVAFTYALLQTEEFPAPQAVKSLWQTVEITTTNEHEIVFTLPQPYAPFLEATTRGIMPAHLLADASPSELAGLQFISQPIGTGPFAVAPDSDWSRSGQLFLVPNPFVWRQGFELEALVYRFFADTDAMAEALENDEIEAVASVPKDDLLRFSSFSDLRLFTSPAHKYLQVLFNLDPNRNSPVATPDVRLALAHGTDRASLIDERLQGQGLPLDGPYPRSSWAYEPGLAQGYNFDIDRANELLESAGWSLPDGQSARQSGDQRLELTLLVSDVADHVAMAEGMRQQWQALGVTLSVQVRSQGQFFSQLAEREYDVALVEVEPNLDPDLYDFWSQEAIIRGQNYGAWNNRRASEALEAARQLVTIDERRPYYQAFQTFFGQDLPALTLYQHVETFALNTSVEQVDVGRFTSPRERYETADEWFVLFRDVATECEPGQA